MKNYTICLALFLFGGNLLPASPSDLSTVSAKPQLLALLKANYVDYASIPRKSDDLGDLIAQSRGGVAVVPAAPVANRMFSSSLPGDVIYWRAGSFTPATTWQDLAAQANAVEHSTGLVLDLRSNTTPDDLRGALEVANFLSDGRPGLAVRGDTLPAAPAPGALRGHPTVIVLTNRETRGAAEALAACLKARGALVMGEATAGRAALFHDVPLASGDVLRYATAHLLLADGTDLWNRPVVPDISTPADLPAETSALALIDRQQVRDVIGETNQRHRMSEAALVRGQDPEQDEFLAAHAKNAAVPAAATESATRDVALVEALDSLKAIRVLQGQELSNSPTVALQ